MKSRRLIGLGLSSLLLFGMAGVAAGASTPAAGPCAASGTYDPACDVDHDGDVDIMDIQKTAGHWNQTGTWMSDNDHNHLGQTWTGNGNPLTIGGTYSYPGAPLVLNNSSGNGLRVGSAGSDGVYVDTASASGFSVDSAAYGLYVSSTQETGVFVNTAGNPSTVPPPSPGKTGFEVAGAERVGLQVGYAGIDGVYVGQADRNGVTVNRAGNPSAIAFSGDASGFEVRGSEGYGLYVGRADSSGVRVNSAGGHGVWVNSADATGVLVLSAGSNGVHMESVAGNGVYVGTAGFSGVHVDYAVDDGVLVFEAGNPSTSTCSLASNGFEVCGADGYGVYVGRADDDGVRVDSAGGSGVWVDSSGGPGVFVSSAGGDGMHVDLAGGTGMNVAAAAGIGVFANTTAANHEWGLYTPDKIFGSNVTLSSLTVIAQVTGEQALSTGDVVAAVGVTDPLPDSTVPLALVRLADASTATGIVGVVEGRMALTAQPQREGEDDHEPVMEMRSAEGPAQPGDYVALTVLGVAQVKVREGAAIRPGQRLTASADGSARPLGTIKVQLAGGEGTADITESAPILGVALEPAKDGFVRVFVNPQ